MAGTQETTSSADSLLSKIVAAVAIAGVLGGIALVTRVEVLAARVDAIETAQTVRAQDSERLVKSEQRIEVLVTRIEGIKAAQALRAEDGERLARIEQKIETLTDLVTRLEQEKRRGKR